MRVLIEALGISKYGGGRSATLPLFEAILQLAPNDHFVFVLESFEPSLKASNAEQIIVPIRNRFLARVWAQINLPRLARRYKVDIVHFAKNLTVVGISAATLVTVYDLTLLQFPAGFSWIDRIYWRYIQPFLLKQMSALHVISENTARELIRLYHISEEKITVIPPPCQLSFHPQSSSAVARIRQKYNLPEVTIAHIGSFGPKKNLETLVIAFDKLVQTTDTDAHLVFIGGPYRPGFDEPIKKMVIERHLEDRVTFTGIVPAEDLPPLMASSTLIVYPSLHEGFGIVAIEAMACGVPVLVSSGGALQEAAGQAACILQEPTDVDELYMLINKLLNSETLRAEYIERGLKRVKLFSPDIVAKQVLSLYQTNLK